MNSDVKGTVVDVLRVEPGERPKILLVDDNENKLIALESVFSGLNLELKMARSGKEALRLLLEHEFAVILLDVSMPVMDGFETAALIRTRKNNEHTPIIFITAISVSATHASHGYSLGAVDYIFAPVIPDSLRAKVLALSDLFQKSRDIERRTSALRHEAERRAGHLESQLESLLNGLNVGVFRMDMNSVLISANPAFLRIFGVAQTVDLRTVDCGQFYLNKEDQAAILNKLRSEGGVRDQHVQQRRIDGTLIWISISKTLISDAQGHEHIDGLIEDITSRKKAEILLIAKAEELARSNANLAEFAYIASHDLQEPLRMVSAYASLVELRYGPALDAKGVQYLREMSDAAKRMKRLIGDILNYSKIDGEYNTSVVDCNEVIDRVRYALQSRITEADAEIIHESLPTVQGDSVLCGQIFQNLISNALKFRRAGERPRICIGADRAGIFWKFAISDNGIGIAEESLERIFQVFHRLHARDEYDGSGIGLAICRKAVHRQRGDIHVESVPGKGSTFFFTLPSAD